MGEFGTISSALTATGEMLSGGILVAGHISEQMAFVSAIKAFFMWFLGMIIFISPIIILTIIGGWKMLNKANLPGWGILIPFYNVYLFIKLAGRPGWWFLLMFVPFVNAIIWIILDFDIAKRFGKDIAYGFGLRLLHPIFVCILGFGDAKYTPKNKQEVVEA